jgi:hypothetical protein
VRQDEAPLARGSASARDVDRDLAAGDLAGGGRLVVSAGDEYAWAFDDVHDFTTLLGIIDTSSWQQTPIAPGASVVDQDGSILLVTGIASHGSRGVRAYASDGRPLYTALASHARILINALGPRLVVYTGTGPLVRWLLDAKTGRVITHRLIPGDPGSLLSG